MAIVAVVLMEPARPLRIGFGRSLIMPAMTAVVPFAELPSPAAESTRRARANASPPRAAGTAASADVRPAAPTEVPSSIEPERGFEGGEDGVETGDSGDEGGRGGGRPDGAISRGPPSPGPLRVGGGIQAPRKIRDVKPMYPQAALVHRARGTVILDATIGTDGSVEQILVLHSVPLLDQAAIDAVRQWEYEPSRLNGAPVAVIMTIFVQFAVQ
jgi:protein TonB